MHTALQQELESTLNASLETVGAVFIIGFALGFMTLYWLAHLEYSRKIRKRAHS
jgi:hypothetical protein